MGIFSILLSGGKPAAELLWAAGGTTVSKVLSKERERENSEGKLELKSVCALVRSTGRQESSSRRGGQARSEYTSNIVKKISAYLDSRTTLKTKFWLILQKSGRLVWTVMQNVKR